MTPCGERVVDFSGETLVVPWVSVLSPKGWCHHDESGINERRRVVPVSPRKRPAAMEEHHSWMSLAVAGILGDPCPELQIS